MQIKMFPKSILGWWSIGLAIAMAVLFFFGVSSANWLYKTIPAGGTILNDISVRPVLALSMLMGMVSGISALITGLIAVIRQKERALLVWGAIFIGALLTIFLLGEFIFVE